MGNTTNANYDEESTDLDCFCDELMEDIIKVIDTLNRLESRHLSVHKNNFAPADISDLLLQTYNKNMHNLRKSYHKYRELTGQPRNPSSQRPAYPAAADL